MDTHITSAEAAKIIGCVASRVRQLAIDGTLRAKKVGRDWLVEKASAEEYAATERKPGRKSASEK